MTMTPLERKAALASVRTLKQHTAEQVAEILGISGEHLRLILIGERRPSERVAQAFADYIGRACEDVFEPREPSPV